MFELNGMDFVKENGEVYALSLIPNEKNANVNGFVHGGIIFLLADEAVGRYVTAMDRQGAAADADVHFYRPAKVGERMTAFVHERKMGKKLGVFLIEIKNEQGKLLADVVMQVAFAS